MVRESTRLEKKLVALEADVTKLSEAAGALSQSVRQARRVLQVNFQ